MIRPLIIVVFLTCKTRQKHGSADLKIRFPRNRYNESPLNLWHVCFSREISAEICVPVDFRSEIGGGVGFASPSLGDFFYQK